MPEARDMDRSHLPGPVYDLAIRLGADPQVTPSGISLTQTGRMKADIRSRAWMAFTASQTISARSCTFDWRARAGPFGLISGRDALADGEGRFDILALGFIPLARAPHTAALVRGERMRYLAEIAWVPDAILHNPALRWDVVDGDTLAVEAGSGETACRVLLSLDSNGRIAGAFAADRPLSATAPTLETPWRGCFADYRQHCGRWLPFAGEVGWEFDGQSLTYWQGRIETWNLAFD